MRNTQNISLHVENEGVLAHEGAAHHDVGVLLDVGGEAVFGVVDAV